MYVMLMQWFLLLVLENRHSRTNPHARHTPPLQLVFFVHTLAQEPTADKEERKGQKKIEISIKVTLNRLVIVTHPHRFAVDLHGTDTEFGAHQAYQYYRCEVSRSSS